MGKRIVAGKEVKIGEWNFSSASIVETRPGSRQENICPVCSTEIVEGAPTFKCPYCGNVMHLKCVEPWLKSHGVCPICKRSLSERSQ